MIEVNHISKDFVAPKKYPGLRGAIKGLFFHGEGYKDSCG